MTALVNGGMDSLFGRDRIDVLVEKLWTTAGWPADPVRDRALMEHLAKEFPTLDLAEQISKWQAWMIGRGQEGMAKSRGRHQRVRNWCANAVRYRGPNQDRRPGRTGPGAGPGAPGIGVGPAPSAAFGSGARLVDW